MISPSPIRVLLVEDDADDALLTQELLQDVPGRRFHVRWISEYESAREAIVEGEFDVVLLDYHLGSKTGLELLAEATTRMTRPILLLTGEGNREIDEAALNAGALDYLLKREITPALLDRSIRYSIRAKESEALLLQRERELRTLVEGNPDVVARFDRSLRYTYASPAMESVTGLGTRDVLGRTNEDLGMPAKHCHRWNLALRECFATGTMQEFEFEWVTPEGARVFHSRIIPEFDYAGCVTSVLGISRDFTTLHEATQENLRFAAAFDNLSVGVLITDADGADHCAVYANPGFCSLTGYSMEEVIGRDCRFLQGQGTDREVVARMRECITNERSFSGTVLNFKKDGSPFWNDLVISPVYNEQGELINFVGIQTDVTEERAARTALQESEERYRLVAENAPEAIVTVDEGGTIRFANPATEHMFGYSATELLGKPLRMLIPERLREAHRQGIARYIETGHRRIPWKAMELPGLHKNGREVPLEISFSENKTKSGRVFAGVMRDITERKRAEGERESLLARLQVEQMRLAEAFQIAPSFFAVVRGPDHVFERTNPAFCQIAGRHNLVGRRVADALPEIVSQGSVDLLDRVLETGEPFAASERPILLQREEGAPLEERVVSFVYQALTEADGTRSGVFAHGVDVTEQVHGRQAAERAAESLHAANETLQALIAAMPLAVCTLDAARRVTMWNPAAERIYGWSEAEVLGEVYPLVHNDPEAEREHLSLFRATQEEGMTQTGLETTRRHKDGRAVQVSVSTAPLRDATGAIRAVLSLHADISMHKHLEEQLRLSQRMEAVGRLAGGIAHDFNNLLMVISGNTQFALEDLPEDSPIRHDLDQVKGASERATRLTQQLLAFSREQLLQPRPLSVNEVVSKMDRMLCRLIGEDIQLSIDLHSQIDVVEVDPTQLDQVLMNLVINARDAMPNGGKLTISTTNRTIGAAEVRQHSYPVAPGEYVVVSVEDTGCGMDPKTLAHAFEPFFSTKGEAGTGLGLATVYGIIKQSGGYIWAESAVGGGTTFHVYLPRAEQKAAEASAVSEPASSSVGAAGAAGTILVVEDEDGVRELVARILSKAGYAVLKACDGEDGLRVAAEHRGAIDLVLTDVVMPRMSGRELVEQLKKFRPSVPVLFMSGYTDDALVHHGVRSSEAHFLQKPVEPRALLNTIAILLDQAGTDTKAQLSRLS